MDFATLNKYADDLANEIASMTYIDLEELKVKIKVRMAAGYKDLIDSQVHALNGEYNSIYRQMLDTNGRNSQHLQNKLSVINKKLKQYNKAFHEIHDLNEYQKTKIWIENKFGKEVLKQLFDYLNDN